MSIEDNAQWKNKKDDIAYLISYDEGYIVYIDKKQQLDWESAKPYDDLFSQKADETKAEFNEVMNRAALIDASPREGLSESTLRDFRVLIGKAIACAHRYDFQNSSRMLDYATAFIQARSEEKAKFWYLSMAFAATMPFIVAGFGLWIGRLVIIRSAGEPAFWLLIGVSAGACGALLSVISRTGKLVSNAASGRVIHYIDAASRIVAGGLSGAVAMLAVQAKIALTILSSSDKMHMAWTLVAIAAGFSERLAPSIMSSLEKTETKPANKVVPGGDASDQKSKAAVGSPLKHPASHPRQTPRAPE
jgi:hypothetical protein